MDRHELALLDVVRLGLNGDTRSLRQKARNLLRGGRAATLSEPARIELQKLLGSANAIEPRRSLPSETLTEAGELRPVLLEDAEAPILEKTLAARLSQVMRERQARHLLEEANLAPTARLLLTGPPGTGKTMTAHWLAAQLAQPLFVIEPGHVVSSLMGESARNLSRLLRTAAQAPGVVLLDELDVYGRHRGDVNDMAEPKRLVNTLLLELDRWPDHSLLVAATNHEDALDLAVRRRFEVNLKFGNPSMSARRKIVGGVLSRAHRDIPEDILVAVAKANSDASGSALVNTATAALRRSIIDGVEPASALCQQFFASRFTGRDGAALAARTEFVRELHAHGRTPDEIAPLVLSTPTTIASLLR